MKLWNVDLDLTVSKLVTVDVEAHTWEEALDKAKDHVNFSDDYWEQVRDEGMCQIGVMNVSEKGKDPVR